MTSDLVVVDTCQWTHFFNRPNSRIGRELAGRGHRLPLSDLVIAAVALQRGWAVYTSDPHFDLIESLKRFPTR